MVAAAGWLTVVFGCSDSTEPRREPSASALADLLAHYDPRYDPEPQMLRVEFGSPGYHNDPSLLE